MAHNLDTTEGQTTFVSAREDAWHQLGVTLPESFTAEEAMEHGLLGNWNVRKTPVVAKLDDGSELEMPDRFAVIRDNPVVAGQRDVLGNVGKSYTVIQNEEHAGLLNALVEESGAHFETAGAIDGGRKVFITMKLPGHMSVGGVDTVEPYIAAINSHDGSAAFTFMITPIRVVCQNTLNVALMEASNVFRVRHTVGASKLMVNQAREALDLTFNYLDGFQQEAEQLINAQLTQSRFEAMVTKEFGPAKDAAPATVTRTENKLDSLFSLYSESYTHAEVRDTGWAAFNALTEWYDHFSPVRGSAHDNTRATKAILFPDFKNRARQLVRQEVGV